MFKRNKWVRHERLGSAFISRAGDGVLASANFSGGVKSVASYESF
jgi:hypothetical protein